MRSDIHDAILRVYELIDEASDKQATKDRKDQGNHSGITSGKHLDEIEAIIQRDLVALGFDAGSVFTHADQSKVTVPGWYRQSKKWDIVALDDEAFITAIELKSISSSFGNNCNNRAEESLGSASDFDAAMKEGLIGGSIVPPLLGYVLIVKNCEESRHSVRAQGGFLYPQDAIFDDASYLDRFRILCERLRQKRIYQAVWFATANPETGVVEEPSAELTYEKFLAALKGALETHRA